MPFNKDNAVSLGSRGGSHRWLGKDPATKRNKQFLLKMTQAELDALTEKAARLKLPRIELIIRAVNAYDPGENISEKISEKT